MAAWTINRESVSFDFLEGEVVAIHLGTGVYYSLRGAAATIWQILAAPAEAADLAAALASGYDVPPEIAREDAQHFLQRLRDEQLLVEGIRVGSPALAQVGAKQAYSPPTFERYADLQDLLLLDPIHDVGAQGWPHRPKSEGA